MTMTPIDVKLFELSRQRHALLLAAVQEHKDGDLGRRYKTLLRAATIDLELWTKYANAMAKRRRV